MERERSKSWRYIFCDSNLCESPVKIKMCDDKNLECVYDNLVTCATTKPPGHNVWIKIDGLEIWLWSYIARYLFFGKIKIGKTAGEISNVFD